MSLTQYYKDRGESLAELEPLQPLWKPFDDRPARVTAKRVLNIGDAEYLEWFEATRPVLEKWCQPAFEDAWCNLLWFTGDYLPTTPMILRTESGSEIRIPRQLAPLAINFINYLTNKRTAELSIYKPIHDCEPAEETSSADRMQSRVMKRLIERIKRRNGLDELFNELEKENMICGGVYAAIDRDPEAGDKKSKTSSEKEGETTVKLKHLWHVLPWRAESWEKVPCCIEVLEIIHVEEARVKYNKPTLQPFTEQSLFTFQSPFIERIPDNHVVIWRTIYKPDRYLPQGAVITNTHDTVLSREVKVYPWSHGEFPFEPYTDIGVPGRLFAMSFYQNLKPMQHSYNNLSGLLKRYIFTLGHPKIIHERGTVNTKSLGNSPSLIGVKSTAKYTPSIMQVKSIGPDPFNFHTKLEEKMVQFSDTHKIGLGDLPPNTRSGRMISQLREIENQQRGPQIDKKNGFMGKTMLKAGSVEADHIPLCSTKYIARVVGKDMVQDVRNLKNVKVFNETKVVIRNSTGFSSDLNGRISEVSAIEKECGLPMTPMEKRDIIGGVLREKHYDVISAARFTCDAQIQMMNDGIKPPPPRETDDLCTFWTTIVIEMQTMYHRRLPEKIIEMKEGYLMQVEELIERITTKNPSSLFAQKVSMLDGYPRLYNLTPPGEAAKGQASKDVPTDPAALAQVAAQNGAPPPTAQAGAPAPPVPQ